MIRTIVCSATLLLFLGGASQARAGFTYITFDVPVPPTTVATGINKAGQIVGDYFDGSKNHGFLLTGGNYITLDPSGSTFTVASKINDAGQIVGTFFNTAP
jgi:hypothetical protein